VILGFHQRFGRQHWEEGMLQINTCYHWIDSINGVMSLPSVLKQLVSLRRMVTVDDCSDCGRSIEYWWCWNCPL